MKRKLCIAIAMCGNSKTVMLDEPTAGMDPAARRALWDMILKQKEGTPCFYILNIRNNKRVYGKKDILNKF